MTPEEKMNFKRVSPTEIEVSRIFAAPRALVFDVFTKAEHLLQWMWGPDEWKLAECAIDLRVGGAFRYVWRNADNVEMGMNGRYREITRPEKIVHTEIFDEDWTGGETVVTTTFTDVDGGTQVKTMVAYQSEAGCDGATKTDMLAGWARCYERLEELLPKPG